MLTFIVLGQAQRSGSNHPQAELGDAIAVSRCVVHREQWETGERARVRRRVSGFIYAGA